MSRQPAPAYRSPRITSDAGRAATRSRVGGCYGASMSPAARSASGSARRERMDDGVWLVTVWGDHDLSTRARLDAALERIERNARVVIDLTDVAFFDTGTLAWLLGVCSTASAGGGMACVVAPPSTFAHRLLGLTRMGDLLNACDSRAAALEAVAAISP